MAQPALARALRSLERLSDTDARALVARTCASLRGENPDESQVGTSAEAEEAVGAVSVALVEAARRGFNAGDLRASLQRDGGCSEIVANVIADAYEGVKKSLEAQLKAHASSSAVKRLKSHACRADYVVSTSANGDARETAFHLSWVLGDGRGGDERIDFTCDTEEMMHLVETLREACRASELISARSTT